MSNDWRTCVLPVLDLLNGHVVRGIGGRRDEYRPIRSCLADSSKPLEIARAMETRFAFRTFYVADLDAITQQRPDHAAVQQLIGQGYSILLDQGIRSVDAVLSWKDVPRCQVVTGLETLPSCEELKRIVDCLGADRVVFSLDLKHGRSLGGTGWPTEPVEIVEQVLQTGVRSLLVLDLADVGSGLGCSTLPLCKEIRRRSEECHLIAGGGVRSSSDLVNITATGVNQVLVASALHDGRLEV